MKTYPVICAYYGCGKTSLAKKYPNFFDIESYLFYTEQDLLTEMIDVYQNEHGFKVLTTCCQWIIELLIKNNIDFVAVMPKPELKEEYFKRYIKRGTKKRNANLFIDLWDREYDFMLNCNCKKVFLEEEQVLEDVLEEIYEDISDNTGA